MTQRALCEERTPGKMAFRPLQHKKKTGGDSRGGQHSGPRFNSKLINDLTVLHGRMVAMQLQGQHSGPMYQYSGPVCLDLCCTPTALTRVDTPGMI